MTSFRSKNGNDKINDMKSGKVRNRSVPSPCERDKSFALGACVCVVVLGSER